MIALPAPRLTALGQALTAVSSPKGRSPVTGAPRSLLSKFRINAAIEKIRGNLSAWLRRDWLAMLLFAIATVVMTYPLAFRLTDGSVPYMSNDLWCKLWDIWWLDRLIGSGQSIYYTQELFYPNGLNMTYHGISWTPSALAWLLVPLLGTIGAYKAMILVAVFTSAYGVYLLTRSITQNRAAAWLGGAIYSLSPYYIKHAWSHPDVVCTASIPIAVLLLKRALSNRDLLAALGAGLALGVTAWTGLYLFGFAVITLLIVFIYLALEKHSWRALSFWRVVAVFVIASMLLLLPRLMPLLANLDSLSYVTDSKYSPGSQADLLNYVIPPAYNKIIPYIAPDWTVQPTKYSAYLGMVPIALSLSSLAWKVGRREKLLWFVMGLIFFILSLGPVLRFNGHVYQNISLPAALFHRLTVGRIVRPHFYHIGLLLPLAVFSACGLDRWMNALSGHLYRKAALVLVLSILVPVEYWTGFAPLQTIAPSPFYAQLANEQGEFAIIDLPLGDQETKAYMYYQTIHQKPIVEGIAGRTLAEAYHYIDQNALLNLWQEGQELDCESFSQNEIQAALDQLITDGFRYVLEHRPHSSFVGTAAPVYVDTTLKVYTLADLQLGPRCMLPLSNDQAAPLLNIPSPTGQLPCGVFNVKGHGSKKILLSAFPACSVDTHATDVPLEVLCLDGNGQWTGANVHGLELRQEGAVLAFTSEQDGHCALFPAPP